MIIDAVRCPFCQHSITSHITIDEYCPHATLNDDVLLFIPPMLLPVPDTKEATPTTEDYTAFVQAVGLMTTFKPSMLVRSDDPIGMAQEVEQHVNGMQAVIADLVQAIDYTRQYIGEDALPAVPGWSWFDATEKAKAFLPAAIIATPDDGHALHEASLTPNAQEPDPVDPDASPEENTHLSFRHELASVINRYSKENGSDTPDFILAKYLHDCLDAFDAAVKDRTRWYGYPR